jgi:hypothetical protein
MVIHRSRIEVMGGRGVNMSRPVQGLKQIGGDNQSSCLPISSAQIHQTTLTIECYVHSQVNVKTISLMTVFLAPYG